ncbi:MULTISPECIES: hypothetical protein [Myxococcus]|uniref:hypothetical protein n=1 Tax=Myxococcus TaxID=32 RepID=UPI0013D1BD63|nr:MULTISPECIES: hypothetical protein [Myxococcus]NVJ23870.1 hypothetical protein [Myxococcus sp. AM011]
MMTNLDITAIGHHPSVNNSLAVPSPYHPNKKAVASARAGKARHMRGFNAVKVEAAGQLELMDGGAPTT